MENQPSRDDQFLMIVYRSINENLDNEHYSVKDLATHVGLSRSMLHRKLIKLTGKSATDLITEIRLDRAKEMLEKDIATASEVAYKVGFNSPSYFNKVFKKRFNISPGAIRKNALMNHYFPPENAIYKEITPAYQKLIKISLYTLLFILAAIAIGSGIYFVKKGIYKNEKSIAVLPIQNLTGLSENDYFADGMHDALIGELGQIGSLRVISRTSTQKYRDTNMLLKDIAHELNVNTIVEGSIFCSGDSLCFLIQLIDVFPKERHIYSNEYYDGMQNVLKVQNLAVRDIAQKIKLKLTQNDEKRLSNARTIDPETYKAFLKGMYYLNQGTEDSFIKAIGFLEKAIERDPTDPYAYAGLALGYAIMGHGQLNPQEAFLRATSSANKAIKLDPENDMAYTALALLNLYEGWDWFITEESFKNAIAKNPNNEIAHAHFAWYYVLFDDMDQSIEHAKTAVLIEPTSASYASWLALLYFHDRDYKNAELWANNALQLKENVPYGNLTLSWIYLAKNQYQKAIEYADKLPEDSFYWKMLRGYVYVKSGQRENAETYYKEMKIYSIDHWVNTCVRGIMAAYLGYADEAFSDFEDAFKNKYYPITYLNFYPGTENLRNDKRYIELMKKLNFPTKSNFASLN